MKALSIRQPWCWAILNAGKDVENRDWYTSFRARFAIHAAKGMTKDEYRSAGSCIAQTCPQGIVLPDFGEIARGAIVGVADLAGCVKQSASPWFQGKYGFVLRNVIELPEPIPCAGALNFWDVPDYVIAEVERQLARIVFCRNPACHRAIGHSGECRRLDGTTLNAEGN